MSECADGSSRCEDALEDLQSYLDGELDEARLDEVRSHLGDCFPCADRASFEEQLRSLVRRECAETAPSELMERIRMRLDASA